jgi:hypothetical protein
LLGEFTVIGVVGDTLMVVTPVAVQLPADVIRYVQLFIADKLGIKITLLCKLLALKQVLFTL